MEMIIRSPNPKNTSCIWTNTPENLSSLSQESQQSSLLTPSESSALISNASRFGCLEWPSTAWPNSFKQHCTIRICLKVLIAQFPRMRAVPPADGEQPCCSLTLDLSRSDLGPLRCPCTFQGCEDMTRKTNVLIWHKLRELSSYLTTDLQRTANKLQRMLSVKSATSLKSEVAVSKVLCLLPQTGDLSQIITEQASSQRMSSSSQLQNFQERLERKSMWNNLYLCITISCVSKRSATQMLFLSWIFHDHKRTMYPDAVSQAPKRRQMLHQVCMMRTEISLEISNPTNVQGKSKYLTRRTNTCYQLVWVCWMIERGIRLTQRHIAPRK